MLDRQTTALVVIDFQEKLLPKILGHQAVLDQAIKLVKFSRGLGIPILASEQYPKGLGHTVPCLAAELEGIAPLEKTAFGCLGDPAIADAIASTKRKQLLLTGIEAHVCVLQTALMAIDEGYEVFVPRDAVGSRLQPEYEAGLHRLERAGVELVTTEMALFEILREAGTPEFKQTLPLIK
ncbi:MAG: hydrolase [Candidatus Hydrogenedentes bacterium]|nr:hydrolase [Candidatus Hydrogenedentota bacterium]